MLFPLAHFDHHLGVNPSTPPHRGYPPDIQPPGKKFTLLDEEPDDIGGEPRPASRGDGEKENRRPRNTLQDAYYHRLQEKLEDAITHLKQELEEDLSDLCKKLGIHHFLF
ncbi:E4 [Ailuropoda melanoleuca papillomavirus 4]|uniref:E4 n=1 Tax=Ailuropoda melanoleuca papillomavirus 4 TaxID=2016453 RepID=A0A220IGF6_9PAPI|nr:E4 [Ailuropoda melanoleuca papillomavirus 4]ASH99073.1 E4 [Ailuropoda melanoleuca papillomavirus 4]